MHSLSPTPPPSAYPEIHNVQPSVGTVQIEWTVRKGGEGKGPKRGGEGRGMGGSKRGRDGN